MDRAALIEKYRPLVERIARRMLVRLPPSVAFDDLCSAGTIGLIEAVDRYDPGRNVSFIGFARTRIRGAMVDELRDLDMLPRSLREKANEIERIKHELIAELGRRPESDEIAARMGVDIERFATLRQRIAGGAVVGFEDLDRDDSGRSRRFVEYIEDETTVAGDTVIAATQVRDEFRAAFDTLPERLRFVLSLYYVEGLTMQEVAVILNVTVGRVSQLHSAAIRKLQQQVTGDVDVNVLKYVLIS